VPSQTLATTTTPTPASSTDLALRARQELAALPVGDVATTVAILERMNRLRAFGDQLQRGMEAITSLRTSQFLILKAIEGGVVHPRHIGRKVGMDTGAVELTLGTLEEKGLAATFLDPSGRMVEANLTDGGRAVLTQAEAMEFRATDALLQQSRPDEVAELLDLLDRAAEQVGRIMAGDVR
jgi:DNA-binding MarR family transcriptional regulator